MELNLLVEAMRTMSAEDGFRPRLSPEQWRALQPYLSRHEIRAGDLLIKQGDAERTMYLLEQGSLQVYATGGAPGTNRIAILRAGSAVGEPGLFSDSPRMANVEAMVNSVVWALRAVRLEELAQRMPSLAYEVLRAAGAVMSARTRANLLRQTPYS